MSFFNTLFVGTPDFALPSLRALIAAEDFELVGVVTQPDRPVGRKQVLTMPPVKIEAMKQRLALYQPERIRDLPALFPELYTAKIDLIVVAAYAQIIPKNILDWPRWGCINVHGSLLPRCRGAACVQKPIMDGDQYSGATIMQMDEGLDTGPILAQAKVPIKPHDTAGSMTAKIAQKGAELLVPTLRGLIAGRIKPQPQGGAADYVGLIKKADGHIDFNKSAAEIERFVRSMHPWPGAFGYLEKDGQKTMIKILKASLSPTPDTKKPAGLLACQDKQLLLHCQSGALVIEELQLEGKKKMPAAEFLCGHSEGIRLI